MVTLNHGNVERTGKSFGKRDSTSNEPIRPDAGKCNGAQLSGIYTALFRAVSTTGTTFC